MILSISLSAQTILVFSECLHNADLNKAIDRVTEEAKMGYAHVSIAYSTSMGRQTLWVEAEFITEDRAQDFINFYHENNMNLYILKNDERIR